VPVFMDLSLLSECHRRVAIALAGLDDADRGTRLEMHLQAALGVSSMFIHGNSSEAFAALTRSLSLTDDLDVPPQKLVLLAALHLSLYRRGELRDALAIARRGEEVAKRLADPGARSLVDWMIGSSLHLIGDQVEAERRLRSALIPRPASKRMAMASFFSIRIRSLVLLGRALWLVGRPEEAIRVATQAIWEAAETGHPVTFASSVVWTSQVFLWSGDLCAAEEIVERLAAHTKKHALGAFHDAVGLGLKGELLVRRGAPADGVELLRRSVEAFPEHNEAMQALFATPLAEGLGVVGRHAEALATIDQAIAARGRNGGSFDLAEMLRMKGHLLATMPVPDEMEAERCLVRAMDCARSQGAIAWELRAATTTARLWSSQGRAGEARDVLTASYNRFTQGFQTADLIAAKLLLSEL
jgi:hypothetical protein